MSPLLLVPAAGVGLYFLLRKKPGFVPQAVSAPPVVSPARAAASVAPAGSPQAAADQAIVDEAFNALPHAQQQDDLQAFVPPTSFLEPELIRREAGTEEESGFFPPTLADVASNPFGTLGGLLARGFEENVTEDDVTDEEAGFFDSFDPFGDDE